MPEQDLQNWLNSLKKTNASSGGGAGGSGSGMQRQAPAQPQEPEHHRYGSTHPAPQHVQSDPGSQHKRPKQSSMIGSIAESLAGSAGVQEAVSYFQQRVEKLRQMQEAMQQSPQGTSGVHERYSQEQDRRQQIYGDEAIRQKEAIYQQIVSHAQATERQAPPALQPRRKVSPQRTAQAVPKPVKTSRPKSALGLSGNLLNDLRDNPAALREAICLLEILGPPLAERDPFERLV